MRYARTDRTGTASDRAVVSGHTNGDTVADFQFEIYGLHSLTAADFIL